MKKFVKVAVGALVLSSMVLGAAACGGTAKPGGRTHDQETHVITNAEGGKTVHHNFVNGKCTMCDETTIFRQDPMMKSPEILLTAQKNQGTIEYFWYKTRAYGVEAKQKGTENEGKELWIWKRAFVYTPYGYDKNDTSKKYNVLYMMHGNKLNEGYWFGQGSYAEDRSPFTGGYGTENMLDYMVENKLMEDTIFVGMTMYQYYNGTPTYKEGKSAEDFKAIAESNADAEWTDFDSVVDWANPNYVGGIYSNQSEQGNVYSGFIDPASDLGFSTGIGEANEGTDLEYWKEWRNHLVPYVVEHYNTYAKSSSDADLIAARDHVGYTGLSRGGSSLNSVLTNCIQFCSYYGYESTMLPPAETIALIKQNEATYPVHYMLLSCGSQEDVAGNDAKCLELKRELGWSEGSDIKNGDRVEFIQVNGTAHNYATWITNLYNCMLVFFK